MTQKDKILNYIKENKVVTSHDLHMAFPLFHDYRKIVSSLTKAGFPIDHSLNKKGLAVYTWGSPRVKEQVKPIDWIFRDGTAYPKVDPLQERISL